jgi:two-component system, NtrC family, nitrogen regulation sensor histidine kinase NtrY
MGRLHVVVIGSGVTGMSERSRKSRLWLALGGTLIALLMAAVFTLGSITTPFEFGAWNQVLILYALSTFLVAALLVFGLMLVRTLVRLWAEHHAQQLGSRFKTKMVLGAMAVSLLPLIFMFFISYALMNRTLNRWFPRRLEVANSETQALLLEMSQQEYARLAALAARVTMEASERESKRPDRVSDTAEALAVEQGADGVWTLDSNGKAQVSAERIQLDGSSPFAQGLPKGAELWTFASKAFLAARTPCGPGYLIVGYRLPADFLDRYHDVESQMTAYYAESEQIKTFKSQILLTLSLFTILLLFAATWSALHLAQEVTVPIQALAEATRKVATGNFATQVQVTASDELGTLVRSFNQMTTQLAANRRQIEEFTDSLQQAVQEIDQRRTLIETVLENIPTGVLSLDAEGKIAGMNRAARQIFGDRPRQTETLGQLLGEDTARDIEHLMRRSLRLGGASKELEFLVGGHRVHAAVTLSPLGPRRSTSGYVLVIDDLTELLRAQKAAAWQEVAQRVAHEIKNPLTPIQLSVERLLRYLNRGGSPSDPPELVRLVGECTTLIAREVGTLKTLVSEFSQFARFPVARLAPAEPNNIVRRALDVFQGRLDDVAIHTDFAPHLPLIKADDELLRRVIVNLIDNAAEAMEGSSTRHLDLATRFRAEHDTVEITIADSGHGISPEDKERLFLPYFSTKDRGTGLGLAIACRIVAEHHGLMRAEDNVPVGTRFVIELPAVEATAALAQGA